jgi:hypothetical protein
VPHCSTLLNFCRIDLKCIPVRHRGVNCCAGQAGYRSFPGPAVPRHPSSFSSTDLSAPKYTSFPIRTTGLRTSLGSFSIISISRSSLKVFLSSPVCLKLGLLKLNISEAGLPPSNPSISARLKGSLKKSRSLNSTRRCKRNSFALRQVVHRTQQ